MRLEVPMHAVLMKWTQMRAENQEKIAETTEKSRKIAEYLAIALICITEITSR